MKRIQTIMHHTRATALVAIMAVFGSVALLPTPHAKAASCTDYVYRQGGNGTCVKYIQIMLNDLAVGGSIAEDGSFGPITRSKVMQFQDIENISVDGVVGRITWSRLCSPHVTYVESGNWFSYLNANERVGC